MSKVGFGFLDRPGVREQLRLAAKAEALGYDSLWVTETRLARDAISVLGGMAATTERVRLGSCIVNSWTRGPALMAMTFATLDNLAPGRMNLGLGAYWDPLAWKQGIDRRKPLSQMREYIGVLRRLLALEDGVTHEGELVTVRDLTPRPRPRRSARPARRQDFHRPHRAPDDGALRRDRGRGADQRHPLARLHAPLAGAYRRRRRPRRPHAGRCGEATARQHLDGRRPGTRRSTTPSAS